MELLFRVLSVAAFLLAWFLVARWLMRQSVAQVPAQAWGLLAGVLMFMLLPGIGMDAGLLNPAQARQFAYGQPVDQRDFVVRRVSLPLLASDVADFRQGARLERLDKLIADTRQPAPSRRLRRELPN